MENYQYSKKKMILNKLTGSSNLRLSDIIDKLKRLTAEYGSSLGPGGIVKRLTEDERKILSKSTSKDWR